MIETVCISMGEGVSGGVTCYDPRLAECPRGAEGAGAVVHRVGHHRPDVAEEACRARPRGLGEAVRSAEMPRGANPALVCRHSTNEWAVTAVERPDFTQGVANETHKQNKNECVCVVLHAG